MSAHEAEFVDTSASTGNTVAATHGGGPGTVSGGFIRQLTGVRFVAAAWVVAYHYQVPLATLGLLPAPVSDVVRVGRLGVDLFFALSGFILTYTYLNRMGPSMHTRATARFWWLRLARVYPVHLVMIIVAGATAIAWAAVAGERVPSWMAAPDLIRNLLLVQEWGPNPDRGWNYVAWSLSMEWLAYLLFPLLVVLLWHGNRRLRTRWLVAAWVVVLLPLVALALTRTDPYYTRAWGSTIRILTEFTAGAIAYLLVVRLHESRHRGAAGRWAGNLAWLLPLAVAGGALVLGTWPAAQPPSRTSTATAIEALPPYYHLLLVPLLIAWIAALALSSGRVSRLLATRAVVLGGLVSYSLYMTHVVWYGLWRVVLGRLGIDGGVLYAAATVLLFSGALVVAWLMWRLVEEPAREWMRGLIRIRRVPVEEPR